MEIELKINGKKRKALIEVDEFLIDTLRSLGYLGVKRGCGTASCGLCTVHLDGIPILSCSTLTLKAVGKEITTIEGMEEEARNFAKFMGEEGADQCGYCTPGFTMTVIGMKKELKDPSDDEIKHYLNGTLCRCTGYESQLRAIKKFLEV